MSDPQQTHFEETYKSMITISLEALRASMLLNGGALVALMAFLGAVWETGNIPSVGCSGTLFVAGLGASGFAYILAYLTQWQLLQETRPGDPPQKEKHGWFLFPALLLVFGSVVCFVVGALMAINGFSNTPLL